MGSYPSFWLKSDLKLQSLNYNITSLEYLSRFQTHRNVNSLLECVWNVTRALQMHPIGPEFLLNYLVNKKIMNPEGMGPQAWSEFLCLAITKECSGIRTRNIPEASGPPVWNVTILMRLKQNMQFGIEQISECRQQSEVKFKVVNSKCVVPCSQ